MSPFAFSLAFFGLPLFQFLSLSLSLSCYFLYSFSSCLSFLLSCRSLFFSLSSLFFLLRFYFMKWNNIKTINCNFFSSIFFFFFWFPVLLFSFKSLFLIFAFFLILSSVFCSTSTFLVSKQNQSWKSTNFLSKGGLQQMFFLWTCVLQDVKSYRFVCPFFGPILVDVLNQKALWE